MLRADPDVPFAFLEKVAQNLPMGCPSCFCALSVLHKDLSHHHAMHVWSGWQQGT